MVRKSKSNYTMGGLKPLTKMGNALLVNKYVLYAVAVLSVVNLMGYMMVGDYGSIVFFILSGILATYFTKNMALTLLVAILLTNIVYRALRSNGMLRRIEGFDGKNDSKDNSKDNSKDKDHKNKESMESKAPRPATEEEEDEVSTGRIDNQKTMQDTYKHLDKMLGKDGIKGLSKEANTLMKEQKELMETMESMKPLMDTVFSTVDKFGGMESLMGMASKLGGSPVK